MPTLVSERPVAAMGAEETLIRRDLAACYRMVAHFGWDDLVATHISARLPGAGEQFLINSLVEDGPNRPITVVLNWWADLVKAAN